MNVTITSKGQITIPLSLRKKFHLKAGDQLEFDEEAPFLKASKTIAPEAWVQFGKNWKDPWPELDTAVLLDELQGPVENTPVV